MSQNRRYHHVTENEYHQAALDMQTRAEGISGGIEGALNLQLQKCHGLFIYAMNGIGGAMASADRMLGTNEEEKKIVRRSVLLGGVAGFAIVKAAYAPEIITSRGVFEGVSIDIPLDGNDDDSEAKHQEALALREIGWQGIRRMGVEAEAILEGWETKVVPQVALQSTFRNGAGIVVEATTAIFEGVLEARKAEDLALLDEGVNWDDAFADLLGESKE